MAEKRQTCVWVIGDGYFRHACGRTAKYREEGGWYCGQHAPSIRTEKQEMRLRSALERSNRQSAIAAAKERVVAAAVRLRPFIGPVKLSMHADSVEAYRAEMLAAGEAFREAVDALAALEAE